MPDAAPTGFNDDDIGGTLAELCESGRLNLGARLRSLSGPIVLYGRRASGSDLWVEQFLPQSGFHKADGHVVIAACP